MGRVIYSIMMSIDGFIARPNGELDWVVMTPELHEFANAQERTIGTHLYGRKMYETMAAYWPTADQNPDAHAYEVEYAQIWQRMQKVVFSTTLEHVVPNTTIVRDDIAGTVQRLKAEPGGDMSLGGATIAASFMQLGLIDDYQIYIHPVILGSGIPMFLTPAATADLTLFASQTFDSGVVFLHYRGQPDQPTGDSVRRQEIN